MRTWPRAGGSAGAVPSTSAKYCSGVMKAARSPIASTTEAKRAVFSLKTPCVTTARV